MATTPRQSTSLTIRAANGSSTPVQVSLFHIEKQAEIDGVQMGVLENGIPYLSERGLARMCGVDSKTVNRIATEWAEGKGRGAALGQLLERFGYTEKELFLKCELNGTPINAYTEPVCLAVLEYFAFVAPEPKQEATNAFRALARTTFRTFVYMAVGYSPEQRVVDSWKHFHDRVDMVLDAVPLGYFGVFREIASLIVPMIRTGLIINDKVVPDISVGATWSSYWKAKGLAKVHGERIRYPHEYPDYYPQSASNPQDAYAYPDTALPEFRRWLRETYLVGKFPAYLLGKVKTGALPAPVVERAIEALGSAPPQSRAKNLKTSSAK